jgi:hypothetical protein
MYGNPLNSVLEREGEGKELRKYNREGELDQSTFYVCAEIA